MDARSWRPLAATWITNCLLLAIAGWHSAGAAAQDLSARRNPLRATETQTLSPEQRAEALARRDSAFQQAIQHALRDQWREAAEAARAALDDQRRVAAASLEACGLLEHIACWQELQADYTAALATWRELAPLSAKVRGLDNWANVGVRLSALSCQRAARLTADEQRRLAEAGVLNVQFERLFAAGKYPEAREKAVAALEIREQLLGGDDAATAAARNNAGAATVAAGDVPAARKLLEDCLATREKLYGAAHPATLATRSNLATVYASSDEPKLLRATTEKLLADSTSVYGAKHPNTLRALYQLGNCHLELGDYAKAEVALKTALQMQEVVLGPQHLEVAQTLHRLGMLYLKMENYPESAKRFEQSLAMTQTLLGENHPDTARALVRLAVLEQVTKEHGPAAKHLRQALAIFEPALGADHPDTLEAKHALARVLPYVAQQAAAERLYRELIRTYEQRGDCERQLASAHFEAGILYMSWNDIGGAERHLKQSLELHKRVIGEEHADTAGVMAALAIVDARSGRLEQAASGCRQALAITQQALGPRHSQCGSIASALGGISLLAEKYDDAERQIEEVLATRPEKTATDRYQNAILVEKLANVSLMKGDWQQVISRAQRVMATYGETLPDDHPHWADVSLMAGIAQLALGRTDEARRLADRSLAIARRQLDTSSLAQSERQQLALNYRLRQVLDLQFSLPTESVPAEDAYAHLLVWKGAIQARQIRDRQNRSAETMPLVRELEQVCSRLATLSLQVPEPRQRAEWMEQLEFLKARKEALEADLAANSSDFRAQRETAAVTPANLRAVLPRATALVDVIQYVAFSHNRGQDTPDESRYAAFISRSDAEVVRVDLGAAQEINDAIEQWRAGCIYGADKSSDEHGPTLRKLIWEPLAPHLAGCEMVLFSPDAELARLPLVALPGEKPGSYLIEDVAIVIIPVPQMLVEMLAVPEPRARRRAQLPADMLLVGDIDYDAAAGQSDQGQPPLAKEDAGGELMTFERLKSAPAELQAVRGLFLQKFPRGKLTVLEQAQATEAAVRAAAPQHSWLLVTTHGFFAPQNISSALAVQDELAGLDVGHAGEHSGALSGLAMAGANLRPEPDGDDGILTAYEVAALDLRKLDLAVLSGCETGLGKSGYGEGAMSLQRAFQVAGARTTVASLWSVPDRKTSLLMQRFYANLWDKQLSKIEALREAQLWILKTGGAPQQAGAKGAAATKTERSASATAPSAPQPTASKPLPPYYWAAFQLSGDWR